MTTHRRQRMQALASTILAVLSLPLPDQVTHLRRHRRHQDGGYTTETVIVTALLVAAAITIIGIIVAKVLAKANSITM